MNVRSDTRRVGVLTTGRADYFLLGSVVRACLAHEELDARLYVCGGHFDPARGETYSRTVEAFGEHAVAITTNLESDRADAIVKSCGVAMIALAQTLSVERPDILLVLGDRFETLAGGFAAVQLGLPLAHLHGGEISEGALDDSFRHALTKLAHLHLVAAEPFAERVRQLGEEDWRIHVVGAPGLDALRARPRGERASVAAAIDAPLGPRTILLTLHPETVGAFDGAAAVATVRAALAGEDLEVVVTAPNQDRGSDAILSAVKAWAAEDPRVHFRPTLGDAYLDVLAQVGAVVGNSSSGVIEAASVVVPVVNLGRRQDGRLKPSNVLDAPFEASAIRATLRRAMSEDFRGGLEGMSNPYGDGRASERIAEVLARLPLDKRLMSKKFVDRASAGRPPVGESS